MDYHNTVFVETDSLSHTHATSTVTVEISPNATVGQDLFYYAFCVSYNESASYDLVACASNDGGRLEIQHSWEKNGIARMRVGVFTSPYSYGSLIGCNKSDTTVAGIAQIPHAQFSSLTFEQSPISLHL